MARPAVVFFTYMVANEDSFEVDKTLGFNTPQYCGYIEKFFVEDVEGKNVNFYFPNANEFQFMQSASDITLGNSGIGWNAKKIYGLYQIVDTATVDLLDVTEPLSSNWKIVDLTPQISNYNTWAGTTINVDDLITTLFVVSETTINNAPTFVLDDHITQPTSSFNDLTLGFGDEQVFFGNIKTSIQAEIYRTEFNIVLTEDYYNSSENPSWSSGQSVFVSEIGIFDDDDNLVAIGKLNYPIDKSAFSVRTFVLELDF